ncbi:MAG: Extracellular serine protease precursor, partial [Tardiphaga sp.]|nr:Extracellular serine protease precursor [Tardiphaga sp.]
GSPQFALNYGSQSLSPTRTELGTRYDSLFRLGASTDLLLRARLAWAHDFNNDNRARALFQTLPTAVFTTNGASPAADGALISAGAEMRFANGMALAAKFDGEFSSTTTIYAGTVTARYQW